MKPTVARFLRALLLSGAAFCAVPQPASATDTWCARVKPKVPGGYLALRGGPSTTEPLLDRLKPGERVLINTARCGERIALPRAQTGTVCVPEGSTWVFVEDVPSRGEKANPRVESGGWINSNFVAQASCPWD